MCDYSNFYPDPCDNSRMCETSLQGVSANKYVSLCEPSVSKKGRTFSSFLILVSLTTESKQTNAVQCLFLFGLTFSLFIYFLTN